MDLAKSGKQKSD